MKVGLWLTHVKEYCIALMGGGGGLLMAQQPPSLAPQSREGPGVVSRKVIDKQLRQIKEKTSSTDSARGATRTITTPLPCLPRVWVLKVLQKVAQSPPVYNSESTLSKNRDLKNLFRRRDDHSCDQRLTSEPPDFFI